MPRTERQSRKSTVEKVILSLEEHKLAAFLYPYHGVSLLDHLQRAIPKKTCAHFLGFSSWIGDWVDRKVSKTLGLPSAVALPLKAAALVALFSGAKT